MVNVPSGATYTPPPMLAVESVPLPVIVVFPYISKLLFFPTETSTAVLSLGTVL
jgi:hypothetical protein